MISLSEYLKPSFIKQIRKVPLLPNETVNCIVSAANGIIKEPEPKGRLLVTTSQRIILFAHGSRERTTILLPIEKLTGHSLTEKDKSSVSLFQGLMVSTAGILIYLFCGYWLSEHLDGPNVPLINMDLWAVTLLASLITGGWLIWKYFFSKEGFQITFKGTDWSYDFEYRGPELHIEEIVENSLLCGYSDTKVSN